MTAFEFAGLVDLEDWLFCSLLFCRFLRSFFLFNSIDSVLLILILGCGLVLIVIFLILIKFVIVKIDPKNVLTLLKMGIVEYTFSALFLFSNGTAVIINNKIIGIGFLILLLVAELFRITSAMMTSYWSSMILVLVKILHKNKLST